MNCIKIHLNNSPPDYDIVIIDFLNVYMRFIKGNYDNMNEETFLDFIDVVVKHFKNKKIFFIKKLIWELPEPILKKALLKHKQSKIFFVIVSNKNSELKYKERDDFVCYSLLNTFSSSILISNDSGILNPKQIGNSDITIDILSLHSLSILENIDSIALKNCFYTTKGDYNRVISFKFQRKDN